MNYEATDIAGIILTIVWACLNVDTYTNPRFRAVLPTQAVVTTLLPRLGFTFCPGLYDVLQATAPPSVVWIESLSASIPKGT
jgi:hypothetical protein